MTLGTRLKAARKKLKLTQREVGEHFDVSSQAVSQWERDEVVPEFDRLAKLRRILKVTAEWLLEGTGEPQDRDEHSQLWDSLSHAQRRQALRLLKMLADDSDQAA